MALRLLMPGVYFVLLTAPMDSPGGGKANEGIVADIDGNTYKTVKIGSYVWMTENLKVSRYQNGDSIPQIMDDKSWKDAGRGAWCYYENEPANGNIYGKLYNWYAVDDPRGLCPRGWRIPSNKEWQWLVNHAGGHLTAGRHLRDERLWYKPNDAATNSTGFSALPSGIRYFTGKFVFQGKFSGLWAADEVNNDFGGALFIDCSSKVKLLYYGKKNGFSCRCIKD